MVASDGGQAALDNFFLHFLRTLLSTERGGKNTTFRIGDGFKASWNLNDVDEKPIPKAEVIWLAIKTVLMKLLSKLKNLFGGKSNPL
jgi:hypothetical protein